MNKIKAERYISAMREGGSLPALVEDQNQDVWITKFRGAGQGAGALVAEHIVAGLAKALDLNIPAVGHIEVTASLGRTERDPDIKELLDRSLGTNFAIGYLEGAATFDPHIDPVDPVVASHILWLDAFASNVDRTWRNANLLCWRDDLWLIDHGAALFFHHGWSNQMQANVDRGADFIRNHILLSYASGLDAADAFCRPRIDEMLCKRVTVDLPEEWMAEGLRETVAPDEWRAWYAEYLHARAVKARSFLDDIAAAYKAL